MKREKRGVEAKNPIRIWQSGEWQSRTAGCRAEERKPFAYHA